MYNSMDGFSKISYYEDVVPTHHNTVKIKPFYTALHITRLTADRTLRSTLIMQ